jgi:hypothetical protein
VTEERSEVGDGTAKLGGGGKKGRRAAGFIGMLIFDEVLFFLRCCGDRAWKQPTSWVPAIQWIQAIAPAAVWVWAKAGLWRCLGGLRRCDRVF